MKKSITIFILLLSITNLFSKDVPENDYLIGQRINKINEKIESLNSQLIEYQDLLNRMSLIKDKYNKINDENLNYIIENGSLNINLPTTSYRSYDDTYTNIKLKNLNNELNYLLNKNELVDEFGFEAPKPKIEVLKTKVKKINEGILELLKQLKPIESEITKEITKNETELVELSKKTKKQIDIREKAIIWGLPLFCTTILMLFLIPAYLNQKSANTNKQINQQHLLDVATVLLLTLTILILGLAKMIDSAVLGTLLGGISGYVLNRTSKRQNPENKEKPNEAMKNDTADIDV